MSINLNGPASGRQLGRLQPGEYITRPGHIVKLVPTSCQTKREAVRYAFQRFDEADVSVRGLARELHAKGFPAPRAGGWHDKSVYNNLDKLLHNVNQMVEDAREQAPVGLFASMLFLGL